MYILCSINMKTRDVEYNSIDDKIPHSVDAGALEIFDVKDQRELESVPKTTSKGT